MASYQILCITKPDVNSTHEHITYVGYYDPTARTRVVITVSDAVKRIDANSVEFYVSVPQATAYVTVVRPVGRDPYIKTVPDYTGKDNLLKLDQC